MRGGDFDFKRDGKFLQDRGGFLHHRKIAIRPHEYAYNWLCVLNSIHRRNRSSVPLDFLRSAWPPLHHFERVTTANQTTFDDAAQDSSPPLQLILQSSAGSHPCDRKARTAPLLRARHRRCADGVPDSQLRPSRIPSVVMFSRTMPGAKPNSRSVSPSISKTCRRLPGLP